MDKKGQVITVIKKGQFAVVSTVVQEGEFLGGYYDG